MANSLEGVTEKEHFGSYGFYAHKRMFATFWKGKNQVNLRLSREDQKRFLEEPEAFEEIPNAWGKQGWTTVLLEFIDRDSFKDALKSAWKASKRSVSKKKTNN